MFLGYLPKLYYSLKFTQWRFERRWKGKLEDKEKQTATDINPTVSEIKNFCLSLGYEDKKLGTNLQNQTNSQNAQTLSNNFKKCFGLENSQPQSTDTFVSKSLEKIHSLFEKLIKKFIKEKHDEAMTLATQGKKHTLTTPSTIREMLHWLSGVPYCVKFEEMNDFYGDLCELTLQPPKPGSSKGDNLIKKENLEHRLALSCAQSLDVITVIEDPLGREPLKRLKLYAECATYYYPNDAGSLYYMFVEMLYKVFVPMRFVMQMTGRDKAEGGWGGCNFGARKALESGPSGNDDKKNTICKCLTGGTPMECQLPLRKFLVDNEKNAFRAGETMGFKLNKNDFVHAQGSKIHKIIGHTFSTNNVYTILCRDLMALSQWPPLFVGDMIAFMVGIYGYWSKYENKTIDQEEPLEDYSYEDRTRVKEKLEKWIEDCPGTFEAEKLTDALEAVVKGHNDSSGGAGGTSHINNSDKLTHNLTSLMDCNESNCAPYLKPMAYDIYTVFVPQFSRSYLSWILHFGPGIYGALKDLHKELDGHKASCVTQSKNPPPSPKDSIVQCPFVLPKLYKLGCDFWDANKLKTQTKKCSHLVTQLDAVLAPCNSTSSKTPLSHLIETIEQFLWSIRLPFAGSQLTLWCVTLCFLCYVFVVPLDHFHIRSHYFNKLRFTIHPSLLLAHQQRRVSEVSYFFDHPIKEIVLNSSGRELPYFIPMV